MQLLNLKLRMKVASPVEAAEVTAARRSDGNKLKLAWDAQGFRKLLVLLTDVGKLLALHNGDGRVVWSTFLSQGERDAPPLTDGYRTADGADAELKRGDAEGRTQLKAEGDGENVEWACCGCLVGARTCLARGGG